MKEKNRLLVVGPGHSGTRHMKGVCEQLGFESMHEMRNNFKSKYLEQSHWESAGKWLSDGPKRALVGYLFTFMAHYMRHVVPGLPVVCTHRPKKVWVEKMGGEQMFGKARGFPSGVRSFGEYWDLQEQMMQSIPRPVLHLKMCDLDNAKGLVSWFLESV